jgi:serpin B
MEPGGKDNKIELRIANRLWGQKGYGFRKEYLDLTREYFGAALAELNFAEPERARRAINLWVSRMTWGKIPDLIGPAVLNPSTRLVLTNAIYFKGEWAHRFKKEGTRKASFLVGPGRSLKVPFMKETGDFNYLEKEDFSLLELPYAGEKYSLLVLLPKKTDGLAALEAGLTAESLKEWQAGLRKKKVEIFLPKFKLTSLFILNDPLKKLGMTDAFSAARADFSGISGRKDLCISEVVHQAFLEVNEEGSEAAAATAVVMRLTALPSRSLVFRADHPFIFLIRHQPTGTILFLGRLSVPVIGE